MRHRGFGKRRGVLPIVLQLIGYTASFPVARAVNLPAVVVVKFTGGGVLVVEEIEVVGKRA